MDILHFDGHGVFDTDGGLPERLDNRTVNLAQVLSGQMLRDKKAEAPAESPPNTGYLLFEKADGQPDLVSAEKLGFNLHRRNVPLVILSACESAAQGDNDEPLGSVAVRLTAAGIPAVLAMTHSVLVHTTRALFGEFYEQLAGHRAIGEALDAARLYLSNNPEKYEVQRGPDRKCRSSSTTGSCRRSTRPGPMCRSSGRDKARSRRPAFSLGYRNHRERPWPCLTPIPQLPKPSSHTPGMTTRTRTGSSNLPPG